MQQPIGNKNKNGSRDPEVLWLFNIQGNGNCAVKLWTSLSCVETKSILFWLITIRRHEIPPFITMGKIVGSQIVRVHMTFDEMGFVSNWSIGILIDIYLLMKYITQLEQFNPNDLRM